MAHTFYNHDDSTQTSGSETTESAIEAVAVGGSSWVLFAIVNTGAASISLSGESLSGTNASDFEVISGAPATLYELGYGDDAMHYERRAVYIKFAPSTTGTKNAVYNLTVESTAYAIPIQGICSASSSLAIKVIEGVTPTGYSREAPCAIFARIDTDNSVLSAEFSDIHLWWKVTGPNGETFPVTDCRTYGGSVSRDLFEHYPGCSICIPVLEGQHGDWKIDLDAFVPGDDGDSPSLSASQVTVAVAALGTSKTTHYCTATGAGSHDGTSGNEWTWAEAETNLAGTDNWHLIIGSGETLTGVDSYGWYTGAAKNWSIVGGGTGASRPVVQAASATDEYYCMKLGRNTVFSQSGWIQDIVFRPYQTGSNAWLNHGVDVGRSKSICLYRCDFFGDGMVNAVMQGDAFKNIFFCNQADPVGVTLSADWCKGIGLVHCDFEASTWFGITGYAESLVEVATTLRASKSQTTWRLLGAAGLTPYQGSFGCRYYNAVEAWHETDDDTDGGTSQSNQAWRFTKGRFFTMHRCHTSGGNWFGMFPRYSSDYRIEGCDITDNVANGELINSPTQYAMNQLFVCCYIARGYTHQQNANTVFASHAGVVNATYELTGGTESYSVKLLAEWKNSIIRKSVSDGYNFGSTDGYSDSGSVANDIFPNSNRLYYIMPSGSYAGVANLNSAVEGDSNVETDITFDTDGRPEQDVSGYTRDSRAYYDYHMTPMTSSSDWAGMAQDTPAASPVGAASIMVAALF